MVMASTTTKTVMVVDDEPDIIIATRMGLEDAGYNVHSFNDPIMAIQHIEQGCRDCEVLVSDIRMPQMDGFDLASRLKELRPKMKVIMMTAFEVNIPKYESVFHSSTSIDNVVKKPFATSKLVERIKEVL